MSSTLVKDVDELEEEDEATEDDDAEEELELSDSDRILANLEEIGKAGGLSARRFCPDAVFLEGGASFFA